MKKNYVFICFMALFLLISINCSFALDNATDCFNSDIGLGVPDTNSDDLAELANVVENANPGEEINLASDYYCSESNLSSAISIFDNVTINGHGHFFDGNGSKISNLFIAYGDNVVLENITFINWNLEDYNGVILWGGLNGTIKDCTFKNNYAFGGELIDWVGHEGRLVNCDFINNTIESGSAIYWEGVAGHVLNCDFLNNTAETGGAIIWKGKNGLVKNSVFTGNTADYGGAIYWDGLTGVLDNNYFSDNEAITDGGAVYCEVSDLNITNSIFENNNASNEAGAVHLNGGDANIRNCEFINNSASLGGAVFSDNTVILEISNSNFTKNSADYGGAVFVEEELFVKQSDFSKNRATYYGGAIYAAYYGNIENSTFIDNAADNGGALTIETGDIANSKFSKNDAKISGGALYVTEDINIKNSTFEKNTAEDGSDNIACVIDSVNIDNQTTFEGKVCQNVTNVYVDAPNIGYGQTLDVTVNLYADNKTFNDCIVYTVINNKKYTANVINNTVIMRISKLDVGNYSTYIIFNNYTGYGGGDRLIFTVDKINTEVDTKYSFVRGINALNLYANILPSNATGTVNFTINDTDHIAEVKNGTATLYINNLTEGTYYIPVNYSGDSIYESSYGDIVVTIDKHYAVITAPDVNKYYNGPERFIVTLTDNNDNILANTTVKININGVEYTRVSDENGVASMAVNLPSGEYDVAIQCNSSKTNSKIIIKPTVSGDNIAKMFRNGTQYYAKFLDSAGNTLANHTAVTFNINGVFYTRYTNASGVARLNINLNPGTYIITASNPSTGEMCSNTISVLPIIDENYNLTKYYKNDSQYYVRLLDNAGNPVGANVSVIFNINGVFYTRYTNASGVARLNINLNPGEYIITAEYNGYKASNTIKVLPTLKAKDLSMKYKDGSKFNVTVLNGSGNPLANASVSFNINGVLYSRVSDEMGIAHLNINLMPGKYIITSSYNGLNIANNVTITS